MVNTPRAVPIKDWLRDTEDFLGVPLMVFISKKPYRVIAVWGEGLRESANRSYKIYAKKYEGVKLGKIHTSKDHTFYLICKPMRPTR